MDDKGSKEYIAKLLKQLEELKRKKAHKEKKLQKLKGCSLKDLKKEQSINASQTPSIKSPDQKSNNETLENENGKSLLNRLEKSASRNITVEKQDCHSFIDSKCIVSDDFKNGKEISVRENINSLNVDDNKLNNAVKCNYKTEIQDYNLADIHSETYKKNGIQDVNKTAFNCCLISSSPCHDLCNNICRTLNNTSFTHSDVDVKVNNGLTKNPKSPQFDSKLCCNVKESLLGVEMLETRQNSIHNRENIEDLIHDANEVNKDEDLPLDMEVVSTPALANIDNFKVNDSSQSENKLSDNSNKSLPSSKNKSSDILDDSLNSNMSFFMSADLFVADYNDKKEINDNHNDFTSVKNIECPQQVEKVSKSDVSNPRASSESSNLFLNGSQRNNFVFNFPKFSTPTEGVIDSSNDDNTLDLLEKSKIPKIPISVKDIPKMCSTAKTILTSNTSLKYGLSSENKFDSPQVNFVLEKRLSSVLDAHYDSPKKITTKNKITDNRDYYSQNIIGENVRKKRKLFDESNSDVCMELEHKLEHSEVLSNIGFGMKSNNVPCKIFGGFAETDQEIMSNALDFDNTNAFDSNSDSFSDIKNISGNAATLASNSCDDVSSQVTKTVDGLVTKVCEEASSGKSPIDVLQIPDEGAKNGNDMNEDMNICSEILVIPETEGLGVYFDKDTEEFLETSTLSQSLKDFPVKENLLNVSSQSKLESPVVNNIVAAVRSSKSFQNIHLENESELSVRKEKNDETNDLPETHAKDQVSEKVSNDTASGFDNSLGLDTSFLEDDTQDLGNFKQVPYMDEINVQEEVAAGSNSKAENHSNVNFTCTLLGTDSEPVVDVEIILFNNVKYSIIQHKTHIFVWRQEKSKQWIKIFNHQIEDMFSLEKMCVSKDDDNLVIIMLLSNDEQYCLQFLIFEKDARIIKLMENTHWLEERHSKDSILLCGLNGLMFAIAQNKENPEVSIHAFISLKDNPRLMTAVLGSTETPLCSLCKIDKLPNALMGISDSVLYVWHILEARLVTAVSLHPQDYIPIKECFWATVENGLIYFLTTCENTDNHQVCQLLAANLATGFCQSAMTYSTQPSNSRVKRIIKAAYQEPFLVVAHSNGAFIWSVKEQYCCAALKKNVTSIAISRDFESWGLLAVGSHFGHINCYSLH